MFKDLLESWSPNKYHQLRERTLLSVIKSTLFALFISALFFILLLLPALFNIDHAVLDASKTTDITITASMTQTEPAYLVRNPDIVLSSKPEDAFISITPAGLTIKKFIYFGAEQYSWQPFSSLDTLPVKPLIVFIALIGLPSFVLWSAFFLAINTFIGGLLFSMLAAFILHARGFTIRYADLWKVTLYAAIPGMLLFAVVPILRFGLPLAIIAGFSFVLWLVLSLLGTMLFAEKPTPKFSQARRKHSE